MIYPKSLKKGDTIGICAPSSGVPAHLLKRLDNAVKNMQGLSYNCVESASLRNDSKCVSADSKTRAIEFMQLYKNPQVAAIIPPWGGEFLMDVLPLLDFEDIAKLPPKWVCGYSDITTLTFALTLCSDIATVHGSNFMNMGGKSINEHDLAAFTAMSSSEITQNSAKLWGNYNEAYDDITKETYILDEPVFWQSLQGLNKIEFSGRMIGGCLDVICKLLGTRFAPISNFLEKYKSDGFIWTLESCEMNAADIYRTLWQMRECGWFKHCNGVLIGRAKGYSDTRDFNLRDALTQTFDELDIPVIYDADIGHAPPQLQIINGAYGVVEYLDGISSIRQKYI